MMVTQATFNPQVLWSQRQDTVTLVINLQDVQDPKIDLTPKTLDFEATAADKLYQFHFDFLKEINVEESKKSITPRSIVVVLSKQEKGASYWPSLLSTAKPHFLKTDFSRWKDEDEEEDEAPGFGGDLNVF